MQALRRLHRSAGRIEQGLLLLEGTHLLQEVLRQGLVPDLVLATPSWLGTHGLLLARLPAAVPLKTCTDVVLDAAATTRHPDGVLLTLATGALPAPGTTTPDFVLALDRLQDPGNLGTLLRTALAAGVERVWLGEGADPLQPKVLRASSGAALALPLERLTAAELRTRLAAGRAVGLQLVAAVVPEADGDALPYWDLDWRRPTALLLGNEGAGLDPELARLAERRVTIPHSPAVESLNVAAAAALLLLERSRQAHGRPGP
ncbi:TrmH family RNA methyltransferase [Synechococcus sp. CCY 9618]|uniref:TrmH family RNA methyltransferase n=1 Tax=Synechococcus sp. CCY 9618 TaxID=2815602 RepID=UPI00352FA40D